MKSIEFCSDIELLEGNFIDKQGNPIIVDRKLFGYLMHGEHIVSLVYNLSEALEKIKYYEHELSLNRPINKPIYFYKNPNT